MENLTTLISAASACFGLLLTTITFLVKFAKAVKTKNREEAKNLLNKGVTAAVQFAERLKSASGDSLAGETKKQVALNEVKAFCAENEIKFDEETVSDMIEEIVSLTKTVNASETSVTSNIAIAGTEVK